MHIYAPNGYLAIVHTPKHTLFIPAPWRYALRCWAALQLPRSTSWPTLVHNNWKASTDSLLGVQSAAACAQSVARGPTAARSKPKEVLTLLLRSLAQAASAFCSASYVVLPPAPPAARQKLSNAIVLATRACGYALTHWLQ